MHSLNQKEKVPDLWDRNSLQARKYENSLPIRKHKKVLCWALDGKNKSFISAIVKMGNVTHDSLAVTSQIAKVWMVSIYFITWALSQGQLRKEFLEKEKETENTFISLISAHCHNCYVVLLGIVNFLLSLIYILSFIIWM